VTNTALNVDEIKADFPILKREVNNHRLVYLDSASSSQKPQAVLDAMDFHYRDHYANIHRGVYTIAEESTAAYEAARAKAARFIGAGSPSELVFTKNITEGINLVAYSWARANLREGDVIVVSEMEHHANIVPWHMLAAEHGIELRWIPMTPDYQLDLSGIDQLLDGALMNRATFARPRSYAAVASSAMV
jgi:cysteine desulfurase/selenocysteine lyase